jgi:hypothetical protein
MEAGTTSTTAVRTDLVPLNSVGHGSHSEYFLRVRPCVERSGGHRMSRAIDSRHIAARRASGPHKDDVDWVRLPGLFHWTEVCDLAREIQQDDEWCFAVRLVSVGPISEPLYVVDAGWRTRR